MRKLGRINFILAESIGRMFLVIIMFVAIGDKVNWILMQIFGIAIVIWVVLPLVKEWKLQGKT